ncbi:MAG: hypothetical protein A3C11_00795 [Candidatus Sungbacteria bacterium RIFCSPHIGHO2_02_FULL_49_12]|uniref:Uncharacterized protein n=1 Tax=Candidatus Sungbacteria bacterium RIFCSPHIGHO2_02_FULL_49_12 TaxID=1802271 RepID=A0A1G2KM07_9BACT|nr:MAG: hypothetical protein A3C11_00795 [Candidatus Sungbacteria bacterium RIFCSPHIGHO2_02_FULL_49_12]
MSGIVVAMFATIAAGSLVLGLACDLIWVLSQGRVGVPGICCIARHKRVLEEALRAANERVTGAAPATLHELPRSQ